MARDVVDLIRSDHERILTMLEELTGDRTPPAGWRASRLLLVQRLVIAESRHEVAEEQWVWPAMRARADQPGHVVRAGLRQEQSAKRSLKALERAAAGDAASYPGLLATVDRSIRAHVDYEERLVLPALERTFDEETRAEIGALAERTGSRGPTRPHPRTPPISGVLRAAGRLVGPSDRIRDFVQRRGRLA